MVEYFDILRAAHVAEKTESGLTWVSSVTDTFTKAQFHNLWLKELWGSVYDKAIL